MLCGTMALLMRNSESKKTNFLSDIEQIDWIKHDTFAMGGRKNKSVEYLNDSRHVPQVDH
jgi:hypothetical protein